MKKQLLCLLAITMILATTINAQITTNGLVAYYPFTGNAKDSSGNGNNGTVSGATLTTDRFGKANSAYSFNGNGQYISVANSSALKPSDLTFNLWIKPIIPQNLDMTILSKMNHSDASNYDYGLQIKANSFIEGGWSYLGCTPGGQGTGARSTYQITNNIWTMVTVEITNKGACKQFINGKLVDSISPKSNPLVTCFSAASELRFGEWWQNDPQWYNGIQDDIRIYNRVLDSTEVQALYHEGGYSLPVTFDNINVSQKGNLVSIDWRTAEEVNTNNFNIQHSNNGEKFTDIGSVKAKGISGNTYKFIDKTPTNGINYYRLESVDKDGSSTFSKVVSVNLGDNQTFSIIPNPATDFATINFSKAIDKATISVYDMTGKQLISQSLSGNANSYKLNTQSLKSGLYVIKVNTATGDYNEKLLINK